MALVLLALLAGAAWALVPVLRARRAHGNVVDLAQVRQLRALERAVERHPSGRAS
jgi:hypothetical protein